MVNAATAEGICVGQMVSAPAGGEIPGAKKLFKELPLHGRVVTGDAMFAQRDLCEPVSKKRGHWLFKLKENHAEPYGELLRRLGPRSPSPHQETVDRVGNRIETRRLFLFPEMNAWLDWPFLWLGVAVILDHTVPTVSATLNNGDADVPTNNPSVTVTISTSDNLSGVVGVAIGETSGSCANAQYVYPTSGNVGFTLSAGAGSREEG